jgi:membrane-associated phospholipid phosphatase
MKLYGLKLIVFVFFGFFLVQEAYPQTSVNDSSFHPYYVNYWVTGSIVGIGIAANIIGIPGVKSKADISLSEFQAINRNILNGFDRWALEQDPSKIAQFKEICNYTMNTIIVLPALLLFDKQIRKDWLDLLLMYAEATFITSNFFNYSFLGPSFQNRFRPVAYYEQIPYDQRNSGNNRNSFYSGHVASASVVTFFMAKVYCDYNPDIGYNKYFIYSAAAIPPLVVGYFRIRELKHFPSDVMVGLVVGGLCGILIPEFHRFQDKDIKLGLYSSPESTGIALKWKID